MIPRAMDRGYGHIKDRKLIRFQRGPRVWGVAIKASANDTAAAIATKGESFGYRRCRLLSLNDHFTTTNPRG